MVEKAWQEELEAAGHSIAPVRKQRGGVLVLSSLPLLFILGLQLMRWHDPHLEWTFLPQLIRLCAQRLFCVPSHCSTHRCVSLPRTWHLHTGQQQQKLELWG